MMKSELATSILREGGSSGVVSTGGPGRRLELGQFSMFQRISYNRLFNLVSGVVPATLFFVLVRAETKRLWLFFNRPELAGTDAQFYAIVTSSFSKILFMSLMIALFLFRLQPVSKAKGIMPRLTAVVGTFFMFLLILFPAATPSLLQTLIGTSLVVLGTAFSIIAVGTLGRSFSIMAEARRLVTRGVYSIVRHPLYLAEEIAVLGIVVQVFSLPAVLLLTLHVAIQIRRMENEETVLKNAFPEYETYMVQTRRLIPGVY